MVRSVTNHRRSACARSVSQPRLGFDVVELCGPDQRVERSRADASGVAACEQPVFSPESQGPDLVFRGVVRYLQATVIEVTDERMPARAGIADGTGKVALARDQLQLGVEPGCQLVDLW